MIQWSQWLLGSIRLSVVCSLFVFFFESRSVSPIIILLYSENSDVNKNNSTNKYTKSHIFLNKARKDQAKCNTLNNIFSSVCLGHLATYLLFKMSPNMATSLGFKATTCAAKGNIIISYWLDAFGSGSHFYCLLLQKRRLLLEIWQMSPFCLCGTFSF